MTKEHETDIHWYKKTYKYLTEERGWNLSEISRDVGMTGVTVSKLVKITKQDLEKMRLNASTIAKIQDWVKKWKAEVLACSDSECSEAELREAMDDIIQENGKRGNVDSKEVQPLTLGEVDTWDLLKTLAKRKEIKLDISISVTT